MNLQQTIAELDKQAAKYTDAANSLRGLLENERSAQGLMGQNEPARRGRPSAAEGATQGATRKKGAKRNVSPETRAKLAESMRARHQQKREAAERAAQEQ